MNTPAATEATEILEIVDAELVDGAELAKRPPVNVVVEACPAFRIIRDTVVADGESFPRADEHRAGLHRPQARQDEDRAARCAQHPRQPGHHPRAAPGLVREGRPGRLADHHHGVRRRRRRPPHRHGEGPVERAGHHGASLAERNYAVDWAPGSTLAEDTTRPDADVEHDPLDAVPLWGGAEPPPSEPG
ncbi:hypothetical protein AB0A60_19505 [Streptomyces sp. NPDC046275]|uniref:hypothetical protein n=1 Tax=Streptomyces sp. NPDC046275 TaxID=3157201 RepID=UPI003406A1FB